MFRYSAPSTTNTQQAGRLPNGRAVSHVSEWGQGVNYVVNAASGCRRNAALWRTASGDRAAHEEVYTAKR